MAFQTGTRTGARLLALAVIAVTLAAAGPPAQAGKPSRPAGPPAQAGEPNRPADPPAHGNEPNRPADPPAHGNEPNRPADPPAQAGEPNRPPAQTDEPSRRTGCAGSDAQPRSASAAAVRHSTLCLINRERARRDLPPLRLDGNLARLASRHAQDMVRRGYFSHETPEGRGLRERVRHSGYVRGRAWRVGENLAWGRGPRTSPREIVAAWMRSRPHRRLILSARFSDIGVAMVRGAPNDGGGPAATYVTHFGRH